MVSIEERIKEIREEIRNTPYNKATQHHIGKLKAKLARLIDESQRKKVSKKGKTYGAKKSGDATVVLAGFPSVGKSTLLNKLTNAESRVAEYDFTTLKVIPGILEYKGAKIQILDVPGLIHGASSGKGRGKEVLSVIRNADLLLILIDVFNLQQLDVINKELYEAGVRLNEKPPDVKILKKNRGGVEISSTVELTKIGEDTIKAVLSEYRIHNADVLIREDVTIEQLIDAVIGNRIYIPSIVALNKIDLVKEDYLEKVQSQLKGYIPISADKNTNLEKLKEAIFERLNFIRVYLKPQGGEVDLKEPIIVPGSTTVGGVCSRIHRDFKSKFRYAQIWGKSVRFKGQRVGLEHVLVDEDVLSIIVRK
jgi:hypothetical protein